VIGVELGVVGVVVANSVRWVVSMTTLVEVGDQDSSVKFVKPMKRSLDVWE
jgi:hypothetical protein